MTATPKTITTTDLAEMIDTTPRTLRKFLRAEGAGVGKGSRYALPATKREVASLAKRFATWNAAQVEAREARNDAPATADDELTDDADTLDDAEPTDADLDEITDEV